MKKKFKTLTVIAAAFIMVFVLVGCGGAVNSVKGENFDCGNFEVFVPEGWQAYHGTDVFEEYEEGYDPNVVNIGKGVESELELFSKPMINITYSAGEKELIIPSKEIYEDGKDLEEFTTGEYTWNGFTATSLGYPIAVLFTEKGDMQIQANITLENGDMKVSLEDADVLAILERIKGK